MNKYFLVYRDEHGNNVRIDEFNTLEDAQTTKEIDSESWVGEIVRCCGSDKETLQRVYPEYKLAEVTFSSPEGVETITGQAAVDFVNHINNTETPLPEHMKSALKLIRERKLRM